MSARSAARSGERDLARAPVAGRTCGRCRHFVDDPVALEREFPALLALSSVHGDCRGDQGVCRVHDRFLVPSMTCDQFRAAG